MRMWARSAALAGLTALLCACPGPSVQDPDPNDRTPPRLTFGSVGLRHEVALATPGGVTTGSVRLRAADSIQLIAQANDDESGVAEVSVRGRVQVICYPRVGTTAMVLPEDVDVTTSRQDTSSFPSSLTAAYPLGGAAQRAKCPRETVFGELTGTLRAQTRSTARQTTGLGPLSIRSFGPDVLRVATFNLYRPGHHADSVYVTWGQYLRDKADVLLLTEVEDRRRAELVAGAAGMANVVTLRDTDSDIAMAARLPIRDVHRDTVYPPGSRLGSAESNFIVADVDLGGYSHHIVVAHFGIRDAGDELFEAWRSAPGRVEAARRIIAEIDRRDQAAPVVIGGDLNAYSGLGPQDRPGATAEVTALRNRFTDPLTVLQVPAEDLCGGRIDYILVNGYVPTAYKQDCTANEPSDHPMVIASFEAG